MIDFKTKIHIKFLVSFCILVLSLFYTALPLMAAENLLPEQNTEEILKQLSFADSENETAEKWEIYLEKQTWFKDAVNQKADPAGGIGIRLFTVGSE